MKTKETLITVALVEDDVRVRRTLALLLDSEPDCRCVGQFSSGEEAVKAIPALSPQVIIMDVNLPGISGVECVRQLVLQGVEAHVLMLTVHKDTDVIFDALSAGASGYLVKPVQADQLLAAVRDIHGGGAPMTSSIARKVVQAFQRKPDPEGEALSSRETEVLSWLAKGHAYKEIAEEMKISYATVHTHIERIYKKLHVNSRAQAVARHTGRQGSVISGQ
jgi:DNA-binding NarL/FixJ family response regulator